MKLNKLIVALFAGSLLFVSCSDDDNNNDNRPQGAYDNGVFVLNEGQFGKGNASVSFLAADNTVKNNIFANENDNAILGDIAQSIGIEGNNVYIVVNNSHKIEVVNRYTFAHVATISTGLRNPRYIAFENGNAYVTNWGELGISTDDFVAVINLSTNQVTSTIPVSDGPERIIEENGKLYVAQPGVNTTGNTVTVIDAATNRVTGTIQVGTKPGGLEAEDNKLYVLNYGISPWNPGDTEIAGSLSVVNLGNNTVERTVAFGTTDHPTNLTEENDVLYYTMGNGIYSLQFDATIAPSSPLFTTTAQNLSSFYGFGVDDNRIYIADAGNFESAGRILVYSLNGALQTAQTVGIVPSGFYFND